MSDGPLGIDLTDTQVDWRDLAPLAEELAAAGVAFNGLGTRAMRVFTYDGEGRPSELPGAALAVIQSFVPPDPAPSKAEVLGELLDSIDPDDVTTDALQIMLLVQKEQLR
jgi:hypothetical protein